MTQIVSLEGEFKKRFKRMSVPEWCPTLTENSGDPHHFQIIFDFNPKFPRYQPLGESVVDILEDAKKEFPLYPEPPSEKDFPNPIELQAKWYGLLDQYNIEVEKWQKKWLGE